VRRLGWIEPEWIARQAAKGARCLSRRVFDSIFAPAATQGCDSKANLAD